MKDEQGKHEVEPFRCERPCFGCDIHKSPSCYQTNVDKLAKAMLSQFETCCEGRKGSFKVVAHSYGAAITFDALKNLECDPSARAKNFKVDRLLTLTPLPPFLLHDAVTSNSCEHTRPLPSNEVAGSTPATATFENIVRKPFKVLSGRKFTVGLDT